LRGGVGGGGGGGGREADGRKRSRPSGTRMALIGDTLGYALRVSDRRQATEARSKDEKARKRNASP
jgi:hypothetical protein